jgi:uncharacterized protein with PIN domain
MTLVLDACAIIAYLRDEEGADVVESVLLGDNACVARTVIVYEVYYDCLRRDGAVQADEFLEDLASIGLITREDMDAALWKTAGGYKAAIARVSLADCFAMVLTQPLKAEWVTSDHHVFDPIAARGICPIRFIR